VAFPDPIGCGRPVEVNYSGCRPGEMPPQPSGGFYKTNPIFLRKINEAMSQPIIAVLAKQTQSGVFQFPAFREIALRSCRIPQPCVCQDAWVT
jgi:hypothetical protein